MHDISQEMNILIDGNGVKLVKPRLNQSKILPNQIANIFQLSSCVYFLNGEDRIQSMNEFAVETCGYESTRHSIGKRLEDSKFSRDVIKSVRHSHEEVMRTKSLNILEEDVPLIDDSSFKSLTVLRPWLNEDNKVIGVFGCSTIIGAMNYAQSLTQLTNLGLLNTQPTLQQLLERNNQHYSLSQREIECLSLCVKGRTAKETARILNISFRTVEHHIESIKNKLTVESKSELITKVMDEYVDIWGSDEFT